MAKIMLVEDDNNLREIYEARLLAEGYEIISAKDGEEALALAVKEKPDLIISDVMMPKISGFDMLDILRSTPETKDTKVIMMTALSQAEDKTRADKLGADRYLVKSQVTLEDVAKVAREVLSNKAVPGNSQDYSPPNTSASDNSSFQTPPQPSLNDPPNDQRTNQTAAQTSTLGSQPIDEPTQAAQAQPPSASAPDEQTQSTAQQPTTNQDTSTLAQTTDDEKAAVNSQIDSFIAQKQEDSQATQPKPISENQPGQTATASQSQAAAQTTVEPTQIQVKEAPGTDATNQAAQTAERLTNAVNDLLSKNQSDKNTSNSAGDGSNASNRKRIIQPINDISSKPDLNALLEKEEKPEESSPAPPASSVVVPGEPTITPPTQGETPRPTAPGNVIQSGQDPNNIAL